MLTLIIIGIIGLGCYSWGWLERDRQAKAREAELAIKLRALAATQRLHQQAWATRHQLADVIRTERQ